MMFGAPWGLLALAAIAPLVAAYFLRRRQKPVTVSALFLWRTPDQKAEAGPRLERFSRETSLLLEVLAVCAGALFLADARCDEGPSGRHLVLVVDGSLSMSARGRDGEPLHERVRREAAGLAEAADATLLTVVESGPSPRMLAGPMEKAHRALSALEAWRPEGAWHDLGPSLVLAREVAGAGERVVLLTDGPLDEATLSPEVEVRALGLASDNLALVAAHRVDEDGVAKVTARIAHFGDAGAGARTVPVVLTAVEADTGKTVTRTQEVQVEGGGTALLSASLRGVGEVTLRLPEDALPADGVVTLLPAPEREVKVSLREGLDRAAQAALVRFIAVAEGVTLGGAERPAEEGARLHIGPRGSGAQVTFEAPGTQRTFVGPFFADRAHPVLEDVQLGGVVWTAGESPEGRALLTAGDVVLLAEDDEGRLHFNLATGRSNVQRTPAWPVLLSNVVRRARGETPGFARRHLVLGEEVPVVTVRGAKHTLRGPDGERPLLGTGSLLLPPPPRAGRYALLRDGEVVDEMVVLPLDAKESDLRDREQATRLAQVQTRPARRSAGPERANWPLLLLMGLVCADFALTARRSLT